MSIYLTYIIFIALILVAVAFDLYIFGNAKLTGKNGAIIGTTFWTILSLLFCAGIFYFLGQKKGLEYLTGYIVELALSIDNIFVFIIVFSSFAVPKESQHIVLFWGVIGAVIFRLIMITVGVYFLNKFQFLFLIFGIILIYSGIKIINTPDQAINSKTIMQNIRKFFPITDHYDHNKFFVRINRKLWATPLFVVLLLIEKADIVFAVDSIPAILSITQDPFIVFTSNIFAILGLRSLYFLLSDFMDKFYYLKYALSVILCFIGTKMIALFFGIHIPTLISLLVILITISIAVIFSIYRKNVAS